MISWNAHQVKSWLSIDGTGDLVQLGWGYDRITAVGVVGLFWFALGLILVIQEESRGNIKRQLPGWLAALLGSLLAWTGSYFWLNIFGLSICLLGGVLLFLSERNDEREADWTLRWLKERFFGILLIVTGACEWSYEVRRGNLSIGYWLIELGCLFQLQGFPFLGRAIAEINPASTVRIWQRLWIYFLLPAWAAFGILIKNGCVISGPILYLSWSSTFLLSWSGLLSNASSARLGYWLCAGLMMAFSFLDTKDTGSSFLFLVGMTSASLILSIFPSSTEGSLPKRFPRLKLLGCKALFLATGFSITGTGAWIPSLALAERMKSHLGSPLSYLVFFLNVLFFSLLTWSNVFRHFDLLKTAPNKKTPSWRVWLVVWVWNLGLLAPLTLGTGKWNRLLRSVFDELPLWNQWSLEGPGLFTLISFVTAALAFWILRSKAIEQKGLSIHPKIRDGFQGNWMDWLLKRTSEWIILSGGNLSFWIVDKLWMRIVPASMERGTAALATWVNHIDRKFVLIFRKGPMGLVLGSGAQLRRIQNGELRWGLLLSLAFVLVMLGYSLAYDFF